MRRAALGLALLLAGCTTGSPRPPVATLPGGFEAAADPGVPVTLDRWWALYGDAQLTQLVDEALARGFSVREALARLEEARAVRREVRSQFGPQGDIEGSAVRQQTYDLNGNAGIVPGAGAGGAAGGGGFGFVVPGRSDTYSLSLPVRWEIDLWGRVAAARRFANADLDAARFAYGGARTTLAADVAVQLFQARGAAVQLAAAQDTLRIRTEIRRVVDIRATRGIVPRADVDRVDTDLATAQADAAAFEAELFVARRSLLALLGRAGDRLDAVPITAALADAPAVPAGLPADLLIRRPDVLEARAGLEGALGRLRAAELAQFPTISLTPSAGVNVQRGVFAATTGFWSIGAGLLVPLLDRARLRARVGQADARAEQAVLAFERSVQAAFSETDQLIAQLGADRRRATALASGEARARSAYDAALTQYRLGLTDLTTLLDVEGRWRATRVATAGARVDALARSVRLFKALGGGWTPAAPDPLIPDRKP